VTVALINTLKFQWESILQKITRVIRRMVHIVS